MRPIATDNTDCFCFCFCFPICSTSYFLLYSLIEEIFEVYYVLGTWAITSSTSLWTAPKYPGPHVVFCWGREAEHAPQEKGTDIKCCDGNTGAEEGSSLRSGGSVELPRGGSRQDQREAQKLPEVGKDALSNCLHKRFSPREKTWKGQHVRGRGHERNNDIVEYLRINTR